MAAALIVIEIAAPKVSEDALSVLVSSCSRAARDAECVLARNASDEQPAAVAIVTLQSEDKMRVEVGVRQGDHDSWRTKDFAFLAADKSMDRWRAIGFAIGTLAESSPAPEDQTSVRVAPAPAAAGATAPSTGSTAAAAASATPSAGSTAPAAGSTAPSASSTAPAAGSTAPSSASKAKVAVTEPEPRAKAAKAKHSPGPQMFAGAAAIFGPGLGSGSPWRLGSALYFDLAPSHAPLFLTLGGSAATRLGSDDVTARWFDVWLGVGVPLLGPMQGSGLEFRAQAIADYFYAQASISGDSQMMSRWTIGLQGAFGGRLQIVPDLLLTAEVQAAGFSGETNVLVARQTVGSSDSFRYLGSVGLRVRLR